MDKLYCQDIQSVGPNEESMTFCNLSYDQITRPYSFTGTLTWCEPFKIKKVIFNGPATIVYWDDGTKTVVKCSKYDFYDMRIGILFSLAKKVWGNTSQINKVFKEFIKPENVCGEYVPEFFPEDDPE